MTEYVNCYGDPITIKGPEPGAPKGYAGIPGTGPAGESCGSCAHLRCRRLAKNYHKCFLRQAHWTGGRGTDVLVRSPACSKWTPQPKEESKP